MGRLTDKAVKAAGAGKFVDGDGLMLVVSTTGARRWVLRYQLAGKRRDAGLGSYPEIALADARRLAAEARALAAKGIDPIAQRKADRMAARPLPTFAQIAAVVIADQKAKTTNAKVAYRWELLLGPKYSRSLLKRVVSEITPSDIARHLKPLWIAKPETARKYLAMLRKVFEVARIQLRDEHGIVFQNPATMADLKAIGFEPAARLVRGHHPSLHYTQMTAFLGELSKQGGVAPLMLEFIILTAVRSGAARAAKWDEFDLDQAVWSIPLSSLKDRKHREQVFRVPLSPRALAILDEAKTMRGKDNLVFPSPMRKPFSDQATARVIETMNGDGLGEPQWVDPSDGRQITTHGFRATFKTWCEEIATFPHNVVEEALGHQIGTAVERAYRRTDLLDARRKLMATWAQHCEPSQAGDNQLASEHKGV